MSDVSTWDPLDANNVAAPPDGWPEFMQPSMVNNTGRMMMGAVRRMYDQQVSGALALPYLKLSGGTVSGGVTVTGHLTANSFNSNTTIHGGTITSAGNITASGSVNGTGVYSSTNMNAATSINATQYNISGVIFASRNATDTTIFDPAGQWSIVTRNDGSNIYANTSHFFRNRGGTATFATINNGGLSVTGAIAASGVISTPGAISAGGDISGNFYWSNGVQFGYDIANNFIWFGKTIVSAGNVNATGQHTGGSVNVSGEVRGGSLATGGNCNVGANCNVGSVLPNSDFTGICGGASLGWHDVVSYNYVTLSDAALKTDIGPLPDTLTLVSAIAPQAFRYGDEEARHWGFVAQDVQAAVSGSPVDLVSGEEGRLGLDYGGLTAMLWKAVQELSVRLTALEGR